jgi:hypothetical protein
MKRAELNLYELLEIKNTICRKNFIESKLKEAGFVLSNPIVSVLDASKMIYVYIQD